MSTVPQFTRHSEPAPASRRSTVLEVARGTAWMAALGVIVLFAFFVGISGASPVDAMVVAIPVLVAAWIVHIALSFREIEDPEQRQRVRDHASRRGF